MYPRSELDEAIALVRTRCGPMGLFGKPEDYVPEAMRVLHERHLSDGEGLARVKVFTPAILPANLMFDIQDIIMLHNVHGWCTVTREGVIVDNFPEDTIDELHEDLCDLLDDKWPMELQWSAMQASEDSWPQHSRPIE